MIPAAKSLAARNPHRLHRDDRLVDNPERACLDRLTQIGLHHLPVAERLVHHRLEQLPAVLAVLFRLVEGEVGAHDHRVDIRTACLGQHRPGAGLDAQAVACDIHVAVQLPEDAVQYAGEAFRLAHVVEEHHELVAAETADLHVFAVEPVQPLGDGIDQPVSDGMAERVVDALEVVKIEDHQRDVPGLVTAGHVLRHELVEIGAVRQAGEAVIARHETDALLRLDARGHLVEGEDAKLVVAFPGGEFKIAAIGELQQDLAVPALAQRTGELGFGVARILQAEQTACDAAHEQAAQRAAEQLVGLAHAHQRRRFRIRHDHSALRAQHDEARAHRVERAIETLRQPVCLLLFPEGGKQHLAHIVGELADREEERDRQQPEDDMKHVPSHDQTHRDRPGHRHDEHHHHARRAVVAPCDGGCRGKGDTDGGDFAEIIVRPVDRQEAEQAERQPVQRAVDEIDALAFLGFTPCRGRRRLRPLPHAAQPDQRDTPHAEGQREVDRITRIQINQHDEENLRDKAHRERRAIAEQCLDERYIDVERELVILSGRHTDEPLSVPDDDRPPLKKAYGPVNRSRSCRSIAYSAAFSVS